MSTDSKRICHGCDDNIFAIAVEELVRSEGNLQSEVPISLRRLGITIET